MALFARVLRATAFLLFGVGLTSRLAGCAKGDCELTSECASGRCVSGECVTECKAPIDCPSEKSVCRRGICVSPDGDASVTPDAPGGDVAIDTATAEDTAVGEDTESPADTTIVSPDTGGGTKRYLTKCAADSECASGTCTATTPRFCTKACATHNDCAHGQLCGGGICRIDDTGLSTCDPTTASPCVEFCYGTPSAKHCTHSCTSGAECPAGYACSPVATGKKICVEIEKPCAVADNCPSGLGFCGSGGVGCTARCDTAADCPLRFAGIGLAPYTCELRSGQKVCVPPSDVVGSDPMGSTCPAMPSSTNPIRCRSGACDPGTSPASCVQRCSVQGGCPTNWGCFPLEDPGPPASASLICSAAGSAWFGDACTRGRECISGICQAPGYCTRLCVDGLCPDSMSCVAEPLSADDGTPIKICKKP